jgi:hypothetical protein
MVKNEVHVQVNGRTYIIRKFTGFDALRMFKNVAEVLVPALTKVLSATGGIKEAIKGGDISSILDADIDPTETVLMLLDGPKGDRTLKLIEQLVGSCLYNSAPITPAVWADAFEDPTFDPLKLAFEVLKANWGGRAGDFLSRAEKALQEGQKSPSGES